MGDRIAVFNRGIVEQLGPPLALYNRPANEFVATFLGAPRINLIDRPAANAAAAHLALWAALTGGRAAAAQRAGLRPEHCHVAPAGEGIPASVVLAEHLGDSSILHLRVDGLPELVNAKLGAEHAVVQTGQTVGLMPDAAWTLTFDATGQLL